MFDDALTTKMLRAGSAASDRFAFEMMQTALQRERAHPSGGAAVGNGGGADAGVTTRGGAAGVGPVDAAFGNIRPLPRRARISSGFIVPCAAEINSRIVANAFCGFHTRRNAGTSSSCTAVLIRV